MRGERGVVSKRKKNKGKGATFSASTPRCEERAIESILKFQMQQSSRIRLEFYASKHGAITSSSTEQNGDSSMR